MEKPQKNQLHQLTPAGWGPTLQKYHNWRRLCSLSIQPVYGLLYYCVLGSIQMSSSRTAQTDFISPYKTKNNINIHHKVVFIPYQLVEYLEWGYNLPNQFKRGLGMGLVGSGGVKGFLFLSQQQLSQSVASIRSIFGFIGLRSLNDITLIIIFGPIFGLGLLIQYISNNYIII